MRSQCHISRRLGRAQPHSHGSRSPASLPPAFGCTARRGRQAQKTRVVARQHQRAPRLVRFSRGNLREHLCAIRLTACRATQARRRRVGCAAGTMTDRALTTISRVAVVRTDTPARGTPLWRVATIGWHRGQRVGIGVAPCRPSGFMARRSRGACTAVRRPMQQAAQA